MTTQEKVLTLHEHFPNASYMAFGRITGCDRKRVSQLINPEVDRSNRRAWYRSWQKSRLSETKIRLVKELGGKCDACGYSGCVDALDFHHKDPTKKENMVSRLLLGNFDKALEEAKKCVLLCCRCHRELHAKES